MSKAHALTVIFGKDQIRKYESDESFTKDELELYVKYYEFATAEELSAFRYGLEEAEGWMELWIMDGMVEYAIVNHGE